MPKTARYTLTRSSSHQAYELYEGQENEALDVVPESPAWLGWVNQISSFAFHGKNGSYTARKERKQRGDEYWYAYVRVEGKLTKRYLGRGIDLTPARLERAAQELWLDPQAVLGPKKPTALARSLPSPPVTVGEKAVLPEQLSETRALSSDDAQCSRNSGKTSGLSRGRNNGVDERNTEDDSCVGAWKTRISPAIPPLSPHPLLATKLHVPRPRHPLVHRLRLIQRLQEGMERPLTLLSAPAGFGKSTLLADWLASHLIPAAWLSLEPQDNEPTRFLSYLMAALHSADPQVGASAQASLHLLHPPALETVLTLLLNDLLVSRTQAQAPFVLVLDNYQVITDQAIHHALGFLLEHLPPQMHLVLATRQDPPLPLAQLRGRGALLELRAADLRFTEEESATYLIEIMGLALSAQECALLQARTEGWITGLHLAALCLRGRDDQASFITAFTGSHHYVADYLLDEVLNRQPSGVRDFLVQTCILDRLSASLCDAVGARKGSQALLDYLERANLFLVPLDEQRQWYRYHRLFAEVLRQHLRQSAPTLIPVLHCRASRWYEQHACFAEAVCHALAAPALEEAARLIEQSGCLFLSGSQLPTVCVWLQALPEPLVLAHPSLCLLHALALMYTHQWEAATARLQALERGLGKVGQDSHARLLLGQVRAAWSLLARLCGDLERAVALGQQALELLPQTPSVPLTCLLRAEALLGAARAYLLSGDVTPTSERLLTAMVGDAGASSHSRLLTVRTLTLLARLQVLQGRLHQAAATYEEGVQVVSRAEDPPVLAESAIYAFGLGDLLREWNQLEAAEHYLVRGMDLIRGLHSVEADEVWLGYAALARLHQACGDYDQALATLDAFRQLAQPRQIAPLLVDQAAALRAQLELAQGHLPAALSWADTCGLSATDALSYPREHEYLTLARVRLAGQRVSPSATFLPEVLGFLERLLANAEANRRMRSVLEVLLVRALALEVHGEHKAALAALNRALLLAEPQGYLRLFLDEGPPMIALLREARRQGLAPGYLAKLLEAGRAWDTPGAPLSVPHASPLLEPLTARERDVLRRLLDGASNREIAGELIVSVNTVKKHVLNIYGKLNVQSRAQAMAKAQALHLL